MAATVKVVRQGHDLRQKTLTPDQAHLVSGTLEEIPQIPLDYVVPHLTAYLESSMGGGFDPAQARRLIFARYEYATGVLNDGGLERTRIRDC